MTESTQVTLLRRMTRPQGQEATVNPLTSSRAVRLALTKAANDTVGLVLTVQSVAEETTDLDDMLGSLADDLMLVALQHADHLVGLIALDLEMRAAVLEMETMGAVLAQPAEQRVPTRTDKMLCDPLVAAFLAAFPAAVAGTALEGWMDGVTPGDRVENGRAAGLILADCTYRIVRLSVDLGVADRQGQVVMVLPVVQEVTETVVAPQDAVDWDATFQDAVSHAPACLTALLHRFPVSLATAQGLQVGSVLPLPGCTVHSVRLLSSDGTGVAQAKLGQVGGYRAVRLEAAPALQLTDLAEPATEIAPPMSDTVGMPPMDDEPVLADLPDRIEQQGITPDSMPDMADILHDPDAP
ncbi:FliM/FliN family flagellar motor switch protein [Yoonia sp.]|uniref:FliM/FliN family flagellar motor switch protein n=1 Tax=Yoonia sp. TaxID=2212373 RepID=UPI00358E055D